MALLEQGAFADPEAVKHYAEFLKQCKKLLKNLQRLMKLSDRILAPRQPYGVAFFTCRLS
ncbi:MAG: hypothetical protein RDU24_06520 [Humidesulfovibrio sp.]|uniref:hypothetical protein n=1 Tax=Humidesulfovibrio sp. TaxID=2910988 RepID=UPI0027E6E653|nr:hypothetical protein [Humidesulfovibrio sp.]MDQ7835019.1 hypothetical protein [Humidesulfovibrio sp.]